MTNTSYLAPVDRLFRQRVSLWIAMPALLLTVPVLSIATNKARADSIVATQAPTGIGMGELSLDRETYQRGEQVLLSYKIRNRSTQAQALENVTVLIKKLWEPSSVPLIETEISEIISVKPSESWEYESQAIWSIPVDASSGAYGVFVSYVKKGIPKRTEYQTFFRVLDEGMLTCFEVLQQRWQDEFPIFLLNGGMSAEFSVQKAAETLGAGVSHTWFVSSYGSGPQPVYATPSFLDESVNYTVEFYDRVLGKDTPFETVIVAPGVSSLPYLSNSMRAPVLPLQFLVSVDSMKEVESVLDGAEEDGYSAFTTVGHDGSVLNGVAWIKLLDLPKPYRDFIGSHKVKNIVLMGCTGTIGGETKARRVVTSAKQIEYQPGSIYVMYPGTSPDDEATLQEKIKDLKEVSLEREFIQVADWESGITEEQITPCLRSARKLDSVQDLLVVTADDTINLYNLGTYVTAAFIHKNREVIEETGEPIAGIVLNPYLISNPIHEARLNYIPLIYWQGVPAQWTVDRVTSVAHRAIKAFFPDADFSQLKIHLNSSNNCGGKFFSTPLKETLITEGFADIRENDYSLDEVWNPADGMDAPCERLASELSATLSGPALASWSKRLRALTPEDLLELSKKFPEFTVNRR